MVGTFLLCRHLYLHMLMYIIRFVCPYLASVQVCMSDCVCVCVCVYLYVWVGACGIRGFDRQNDGSNSSSSSINTISIAYTKIFSVYLYLVIICI